MRPDIVVVRPLMAAVMDALADQYTPHLLSERGGPAGLPAGLAPNVQVLVTDGGIGADAALMDALPGLKLIAISGVGTDAVDLDAARARQIDVTNTPDVLTDDVADMAIGLTLAVLRQLCAGDRFVREGHWQAGPMPLTRSLTRRRVGIVGLGRVGRAIARRFEAFGCQIAYCGRRPQVDLTYARHPGPEALAAASDILVACVPGGPITVRLIDAAVLAALGPDGVLVNVARGSVVDQPALIAALSEGRIAGAGLDVFEDEPNVPQELLTLPNVVLQPHHASGTVETRWAMGQLVLQNVAAHFAGMPLLTPVH